MNTYSFHIYDNILSEKKNIILKHDIQNNQFDLYSLLMSSSIGDLNSIIVLESKGLDLNKFDYDGRTALHLACSEGHLDIVEYLIKKGVNTEIIDRWNNKPIDDINKYKSNLVNDNINEYNLEIIKCDKIIDLLNRTS